MRLTDSQLDRAYGVVLGAAAGDALGAGYEFGTAYVGADGAQMIGGGLGNFEPGEWTDDTAMTWAVLEGLASGGGVDRIAANFRTWYDANPPDIGIHTRRILAEAGPDPDAATMTAASYAIHARTGHTAGNGSLMRTSPIALAHLDDPEAVAELATRVSRLTHFDPVAGEACVLWSLAIRTAVLEGRLDLRSGLTYLAPEAATRWESLIDAAETQAPHTFTPNGWVITAFQAAWAAIVQTPDGGNRLSRVLDAAVRIGDDTDTVAAIAGALIGAVCGASSVPASWRDLLHGYPGITGESLLAMVRDVVDS